MAQTRIDFNEQQLLELIHQHLVNKGLTVTANLLLQEANLPEPPPTNLPPARPTPASAFPSTVSHRGGSTPATPTSSRVSNNE